MQNEITFTFRRFEDRFAILFNELTDEIKWPIKNLPDDVQPNDTVKLRLISSNIEQAEQVAALKQTLEELVN